MQRLFSTFPDGLPGIGLVLLRTAVAVPFIDAGMSTALSPSPMLAGVVMAGLAILLVIGLWTPLAAALIGVAELGRAVSHPAHPWTFVESAALAAALAMLGPGGYSVDARLFGRKHIQFPKR